MIRLAKFVVAIVAIYLAAAWAGGWVPVNHDWRQAAQGVTIHVATNGYHSGIIIPASAAGVDWRNLARDLPDPRGAGVWLFFGWGDRAFYLETPALADLKPATAVSALLGLGPTVLHVDHLDAPAEVGDARRVVLTVAQYRRLATFIRQSFAVDAAGRPVPTRGYGGRDVFYAARGSYSARRTCNVWTGEALAAAGVRIGAWPVFSAGVMRWFPAAAGRS